jgi:hypothetical protein
MLICNKCKKEIINPELTELEEGIQLLMQDYEKDYCPDCLKKITKFLNEDYELVKKEELDELITLRKLRDEKVIGVK